MIRDNNSQTLNSLTINKVHVTEDGQLEITTNGRYRLVDFSEKETQLIDTAIHEAYKKAAKENTDAT